MTLDELPFTYPDVEQRPSLATRRKCLHPRAARRPLEDGGTACTRCGRDIPAEEPEADVDKAGVA